MQESRPTAEPVYESRLPQPLARLKRWLVAHHMTLMTIADTPHSVALGSAIGIFFGFTPLYPLKTLLSIAVAWVARCNKIAAAIAVTLHDVVIWAMPAIYFAEYHLGCWSLHRPVAGRLAHLLAGICWFALSCHSVSDHRLLFDANTGEPRADAGQNSLNK